MGGTYISVISSREEALKAEAEHAKHLRTSLEEHGKENEVTVFSEGTMKKDCDRLRKYKDVRKKEKERLTTEFVVLNHQMNVNPEDEGVAVNFTRVGSRIAELDELFNTVDLAIEFKNKKWLSKICLGCLNNCSLAGSLFLSPFPHIISVVRSSRQPEQNS